jgi:uncharacterized repeat protein (TIGR03803 family)
MTNERKQICRILWLMLAAAMASPAQDEWPSANAVRFKSLFSFDGTNGEIPGLNLVQGLDGNLYGATIGGGSGVGCAPLCGVLFKLTQGGAEATLYNFCSLSNCTDGSFPIAQSTLALATDGNLYGVTEGSGANGFGTVFKISPGGTLTALYSFCSQPNCVDPGSPYDGVVRGADGNFYGVMPGGGANSNPSYCGFSSDGTTCGAAYRITPEGTFSIIYNFCSQASCADGGVPMGPLISSTDGNIYGTTAGGGANNFGTAFKLSLAGKLTTLHSFNGIDGWCFEPGCQLVQANNGNFYGLSAYGGSIVNGTQPGTFFEITQAGAFTMLYNFCSQTNCADGQFPTRFVQATDGNFYGAANLGGSSTNCGTLFKMTPTGALTILHSFGGTDGCNPGGLVQATNGVFYGEANAGRPHSCSPFGGCGTLFSLSVGLKPFVETLPSAGKGGAHVEILGSDLTGATSVTFNGVDAAFTFNSGTLISATVPTGATTGEVEIVTPTRTLKSNVKFVVRP